MEKVLLIIPPHEGRAVYDFPLGLGYVASAIHESGFKAEVLDINALQLSKAQVVDALKEAKTELFGISAFSTQYRYYVWLTDQIKRLNPGSFIMAGGPLPTHQSQMVLATTPTDVCIIGEGDQTIRDLLHTLPDVHQVKGIAYRENGSAVTTRPQPSIDLDSLDFHPYHLFPEERYFANLGRGINIATSRGCPFKCAYCSKTIPGLRMRSIAHLEEELKYLKKQYHLRGIRFTDELAISSKKRGYELADMLGRLNLSWGGQARVDIIDYKLLKYMRRSGCHNISAGLESGSQKILDAMRKKTTVQQNIDFIRNCQKAGVEPWVQLIFGYEGEDEETIRENIEFFNKAAYCPPTPDFVGKYTMGSIATPLPGSALYDRCLADGRIPDEREFALQIGRGYYIARPEDVKVNLTAWSNEDLLKKKEAMETAIWENYRRRENRPGCRIKRLGEGLARDFIDFVTGYGNPYRPWGLKTFSASVARRVKRCFQRLEPRDVIPRNTF